MEDTVWVLVIEHRYGFNHYANKTEEGVKNTLWEYVQEWWDDYADLGEIPEGRQNSINEYFEYVDDEWYTYEKVTVHE